MSADTHSTENHKACPKCFFDNVISAYNCEFCGWQLLDEKGEETVFIGTALAGQEKQVEAEKNQYHWKPIPDDTQGLAETRLQTLHTTEVRAAAESLPTPAHQQARPKTFHLAGELGHFEVQQIIGKGGMGAVYKAVDEILERPVAIKVLRQHRGLDQAGKDFLLEEARTICKLSHPNIVTVFDIARGTDNNFIIMEWIDGQTLDKLIPTNGLDVDTALNYAGQIVQGLIHAHQHHIIHSDIKPQNIMRTSGDTIKILDFGIAGLVDKQRQHVKQIASSNNTSKGFIGTPGYVSPEQALGKLELDERSDIFAFGIVLYQMLSGKRPFEGKNAKAKTAAIITGDYPALPASIPEDIRAIVEHCLKLAPNNRYQNSAELADDLKRFQNGNPVSVIASKRYWLKKKTVKHRWPVLTMTLVALAGAGQLTWQKLQSAQQLKREQLLTQFTRQVENLEANVQLTRMSPAHDTTASQQAWQASIAEIQVQIPQLGDSAKGPGNYAMGRMYYVLQDYEKALQHLQSAWAAGFTEDRTAYYLALTHSALYQQQYAIIQNLDSNSAKRDRLEVLDKKHKQPAITYLQQGMSDSPFQGYAQALLTFYQGENQQALDMLQNLTDTPAWFYDHHVLQGDILLNQADFHGSQGDQEKSNELAQKALQSYEIARALGRSDLQVQLKPLSVYGRTIRDALYGDGENIPELLEQAKVILASAQTIAPNDYLVPYSKGELLSLQSNYEQWFVGDPLATQDTMIDAFESALELAPDNSDVLLKLGLSYAKKLGALNLKDLPESGLLDKARQAFDAIPIEEQDYFYFNSLGIFLSEQAVFESEKNLTKYVTSDSMEVGYDYSSTLFAEAEKVLKQARQAKPKRLGAAINLGSLYLQWANESSTLRANPLLSEALNTFLSLLKENPEHFVIHYYLGMAYRIQALNQSFLLQDAKENLLKARLHLQKAEQIQPGHPYVASETMIWFVDFAEYQWQQGISPYLTLEEGISYIKNTLSNNPDNKLIISNYNSLWLRTYLLNHFDYNEIFPQLPKLALSSMSTAYPPVIDLLPEILNGSTIKVSKENLMAAEFPNDFNFVAAELMSIYGNYEESEFRYINVSYKNVNKVIHLLFQRQNYQRWLSSLGNGQVNEKKLKKEIATKLSNLDSILEEHFSMLWRKLREKTTSR